MILLKWLQNKSQSFERKIPHQIHSDAGGRHHHHHRHPQSHSPRHRVESGSTYQSGAGYNNYEESNVNPRDNRAHTRDQRGSMHRSPEHQRRYSHQEMVPQHDDSHRNRTGGDDKIKVIVRVRPIVRHDTDTVPAVKATSDRREIEVVVGDQLRSFGFNLCCGPDVNQVLALCL
mgnify:CR=1 FL=1